MSLTAGIVGLPNVGKSTLFNAITQSKVEAANYPFATINPNVGVVEVPDHRLYEITQLIKPKKTIPTTFEFTDIAGLVKGASQGEGLGNKFLSHIREVDAICHVVRCFEDLNITHVEDSIDPIRDIEIINYELILADLATIENRISKVARKAKSNDKEAQTEHELLAKLKVSLEEGKSIRNITLTKDEHALLKSFNLLTSKPLIYVANISEDEINTYNQNKYYNIVKEYADNENSLVIAISAKIEEELSGLEPEDKAIFLEELEITESGLDKIVTQAYKILDLCTYFTAGEQEVRAWTFKKGMTAPACAGIIHSDFEKGFIRAETFSYTDLMTYKSEQAIKDAGKFRLEGKDYQVKDGDILHFRFNV